MTADEYCESCCKNDVCKFKEQFLEYYKKAEDMVKICPEAYNDIKCRKHLTKFDTMRVK